MMTGPGLGAERLRELARIGARQAAGALAQLAGCTLATRGPESGRAFSREEGPWETGLYCEVQGALRGVVGLALPPDARKMLVASLLGGRDGDAEAVESALRELGNIVVSQAVSAVADELGDRLLPSVPTLASRDGEAALTAFVERRNGAPGALRFECLLENRSQRLCVLFVIAPD